MHSSAAKPALARRRLPWRLGLHLLAECAVPVFGAIAILTMTCLLLAVFDDLPDFQGSTLPVSTELLYFLARALDPIETIFPFAAFLGVSFMTIVLGKNSELTAIRAAGLSLLVAAIPVWLLCLTLCGLEMYLTEVVRPRAIRYTEQIRTELDDLKQARRRVDAQVKAELERQLRDTSETMSSADLRKLEQTLRQEFSLNAQKLKAAGKASTRSLNYYNAQSHTEWFFADFQSDAPSHGVVLWRFDEAGRLVERQTAFQAEYVLAQKNWHFIGGEHTQFEYTPNDSIPRIVQPQAIAQQDNAMKIRTLLLPDSPAEIEILAPPPDTQNLGGLLKMLHFAERLPLARQRFVRTMVSYRLFYPLSTLVAGLLGFAFTLTQGRKSSIGGFVLAAILLMVYYSLAQQAVVLGRSGLLPPPLAGTLPTLLALACSFWLAWRRQ